MFEFLLFIIGLLIIPAVVGGYDLVYYAIDLVKQRRALRKIKYDEQIKTSKESKLNEKPLITTKETSNTTETITMPKVNTVINNTTTKQGE